MNHYLAGIEYFQEEYEDKNLIFLAVSDDIAWVQKHLGKIKGTMKRGHCLILSKRYHFDK